MSNKIKIRTMRNDLANAGNEESPKVELKNRQDKNKINISRPETTNSGAISVAGPNKLKDNEVSELRNLIKKISKTTDKETSEKKETEGKIKNVATKITSKKTENKQREQHSLKNNEEKDVDNKTVDNKTVDNKTKELKNLIDKISKTIEKEKTKKDKESFWGNISENLKDDKSPELQKINEPEKKDQQITESVKDIKSAEKEHSDSGILTKGESPKIKEEDRKEIKKSSHGNKYQSPENRLIFGKQKRYSSVSKRIKLKEKNDDIENLKDTNEAKDGQKIISEDEKYKKLKNRVIRKYNIKLFLLPWKKIILISTVLIISTGAIYYVLMKKLTPPPVEPPVIVAGIEIEDFAKIKGEVEFTKDNIVKIGFKENKINKEFRLNAEAEELRVIIRHNSNIILPRDAMESIKINTNDFPDEFWETITKSYNIFALKAEKDSFKFAIAIESNDITLLLKTMRIWEKESVDKKKVFNVFEPIFTDNEIEESLNQPFKSANYKQVYIRYINLPDQNTSFDYFANGDTLVITASKENVFRMIDILSDDDNYNYSN